jgi:hypothetical protein
MQLECDIRQLKLAKKLSGLGRINFDHDLSRSMARWNCGDRSCVADNYAGLSHNPKHGFPEGVHVSVGTIVERSTGYSKTVDPCPHNLKSIKFDVMFSTFISSSTENGALVDVWHHIVNSEDLTLYKK